MLRYQVKAEYKCCDSNLQSAKPTLHPPPKKMHTPVSCNLTKTTAALGKTVTHLQYNVAKTWNTNISFSTFIRKNCKHVL